MTWAQVRDLGAISRCEIPFGCRRDCAEIAHLHPGHLEALKCGGGCRACRRGIQNARDGWVATISARMAAFAAWGPHGPLGTLARGVNGPPLQSAPHPELDCIKSRDAQTLRDYSVGDNKRIQHSKPKCLSYKSLGISTQSNTRFSALAGPRHKRSKEFKLYRKTQ